MKKVLFYFSNYCGENSRGGTEVATYRIASALKNTGQCMVYNAFHDSKGYSSDSIYADTIVLPKTTVPLANALSDFIRTHEIDNVDVMGRFFKIGKILKGVKKSGRTPGVIFMQHFAPGSEKKKTSYSASFHLWKLNPTRTRYIFRALFYPLVKLPRTLRWKSVYKRAYQNCDKVVLLSEGYKDAYCKVGGFSDKSKFEAIPNIFELPEGIERSSYQKQKRVLILSRMDEIQKRISLALKIWEKIEKDPGLKDWYLDIVGTGNNTDIVKRLLKKSGLKNVTMHGWQNREPFLERSSILMMTSEYEGLPLSILEAQAYGCLPIAFNSFASLGDVITDGENGVIVEKFGDIETYAEKLKLIMKDKEYRDKLALNSAIDLDKFSAEKIADKWLRILT